MVGFQYISIHYLSLGLCRLDGLFALFDSSSTHYSQFEKTGNRPEYPGGWAGSAFEKSRNPHYGGADYPGINAGECRLMGPLGVLLSGRNDFCPALVRPDRFLG